MSTCRICGQDFSLHRLDCPRSTAPPAAPRPVEREQTGRYVAPSRRGRPSRDQYLAEVTTSPGHKAAIHRERQRRYRARKKAS